MEKARRSAILILALVLLAGTQWAVAREVSADVSFSRPITTVIVDGFSARSSEDAADLAISFVTLLDTLQSDELFMLMVTDDSTQFVGPHLPTDAAYNQARAEFDAVLRWPVTIRSDGLQKVLSETHSALSEARAAEGSDVYLLVGDSPHNDFDSLSSSIKPIVARMADQGWNISGVSLPGASNPTRSFLDQVSSASGGHMVDLTTHVGLTAAAHVVLGQQARGTLSEVGSRTLQPHETMSSIVSVAPGTSKASMFIFRDSRHGSFQLSDPTGFAISEQRTTYRVQESPNVIIWEIEDPLPGHWKIDGSGIDGNVSVWDHANNAYRVVLQTPSTVPLREPATIAAYVADDERLVKLEDAQVIASFLAPDGSKFERELLDDGAGPDQVAGDGIYTIQLDALSAAGEYDVEMELYWANFNHSLTSFSNFRAEAYPSVLVDSLEMGELVPGERTHIADVLVHIDSAPYAVPAEALIPVVNAAPGTEAEVEVVSRSLFGDGPAWDYDIYLTVSEPGTYSVALQLTAEFGGAMFSKLSDMIVLRSDGQQAPIEVVPAEKPIAVQPVAVEPAVQPVVVVPAVQPVVAEPAVQPAAVEPAAQPAASVPDIPETDAGALQWIALLLVPLLTAAGVGIYFLTQTRPYGYIYGDRDERLADFSAVRRNPFAAIFRRSYVSGAELGIPGLEGVAFRFSGADIHVHKDRASQSTVRVNNQPLIDQAVVQNRTWIGARGKLYTFLTTAPGLAEGGIVPEAASAD